jgi:hypothetical protein
MTTPASAAFENNLVAALGVQLNTAFAVLYDSMYEAGEMSSDDHTPILLPLCALFGSKV